MDTSIEREEFLKERIRALNAHWSKSVRSYEDELEKIIWARLLIKEKSRKLRPSFSLVKMRELNTQRWKDENL